MRVVHISCYFQAAPQHGGVKIGRPGYRVTKLRDPDTFQKALLFEIDFPEILTTTKPHHRFMSAWEQKVVSRIARKAFASGDDAMAMCYLQIEPPDGKYQYVLFAADPYETIGKTKLFQRLYIT